MGKRKALMEQCDNPNCQTSYEFDKEDPNPGYHLGKGVYVLGGGGGPIPATYACSTECIVPAIDANIDRMNGRDPVTGHPL